MVSPDNDHHPKDRGPHNQDIDRRQWQVPHLKLDRCEDQVRHEIDGEGQRHPPRHCASDRLHEHEPKADQDDRVEDRPDRPDRRWSGRPGWFSESVVPFDPGH